MNKKLKPLPLDFDFESKSVLKSLPSANAALAELKGIASTYYQPFFQSILLNSVKNLAKTWQEMSCSHAVMQSCSHAVMQSDLISDTNQHYLSLLDKALAAIPLDRKTALQKIAAEAAFFVAPSGNLRRLYCPFKVICLINFPAISKVDKVSVDAVKLTVEVREVYIIRGIAYHIAYFRITLEN